MSPNEGEKVVAVETGAAPNLLARRGEPARLTRAGGGTRTKSKRDSIAAGEGDKPTSPARLRARVRRSILARGKEGTAKNDGGTPRSFD